MHAIIYIFDFMDFMLFIIKFLKKLRTSHTSRTRIHYSDLHFKIAESTKS